MLTYTLKKRPAIRSMSSCTRASATILPPDGCLPGPACRQARAGRPSGRERRHGGERLCPAAGRGLCRGAPRSGVYVCAIGSSVPVQPPHMPSLPQPTAPEPLFDLSGGTGEDVPFPASVWVRTMREVIADKRLMQPVDFAGAPELRAAIAAHLEQARGLRVSPEQIFIGAGTEYLYGLIVQLLGRRLRYAVEDPRLATSVLMPS